jgi:hypothetical protein
MKHRDIRLVEMKIDVVDMRTLQEAEKIQMLGNIGK